jgi:pentatricopeptide repeat domain-containing protein 3
VEVTDLQRLIKDSNVTDAILVYKLLQKNNIEISNELRQEFLEFVCFYNCEEPLEEDLIEERWFRQSERLKEKPRKTWKDYDMAEQLFNEIEQKDSKAYSCMIRGMCKYYQVEKAYAIYNDCLANNIELNVEVFNSILNIVSMLKENAEMKWKMVLEILTLMKERNVDPNLGTLNACLNAISNMFYRHAKEHAIEVITEFKKINITPSLASWYYVLNIFCKDRGPVSHVLVDIMNEIEGQEFEIRDVKDTHFFVTAMDVCRNHLSDVDLAKRVDALLHHGDNYNLIGDSYRESVYYRNFFFLLIQSEPLEKFMNEHYYLLVPHVYIPEPAVMEEILKAVESNDSIENLPLLWSHIICFDQITRENIISSVLQIILKNDIATSSMKEQFSKIAWDIFSKIEERNEMRSKPLIWSGKLLGDILKVLCRTEEFDKATSLMEKLSNDQQKVLGEPEFQAMEDYVNLCVVNKQPSKAIKCLQYCTGIGFDQSRDLAKKICKEFTLDENHTKKIAYHVGMDIFREVEKEIESEKPKVE